MKVLDRPTSSGECLILLVATPEADGSFFLFGPQKKKKKNRKKKNEDESDLFAL